MSDIDLLNAISEADEWLADHRVSESWRVINRLRDALVRAQADVEAAVREQVAQEIDRLQAGAESNDDRVTLRAAARIARGAS